MSLPRIAPVSKLGVFKFYDNYAIHEAVLHEGTILKLAMVFQAEQREEAFRFAFQLSQKYVTLISPCAALYRVWVDIRCQTDFRLSCPIKH